MEPYQERVIEEKQEVSKKIVALTIFIQTDETFEKLSNIEQIYLRQQLYCMSEYAQVLSERIQYFKQKKETT